MKFKLCQELVAARAHNRYHIVVFCEETRPAYDRVHLAGTSCPASPTASSRSLGYLSYGQSVRERGRRRGRASGARDPARLPQIWSSKSASSSSAEGLMSRQLDPTASELLRAVGRGHRRAHLARAQERSHQAPRGIKRVLDFGDAARPRSRHGRLRSRRSGGWSRGQNVNRVQPALAGGRTLTTSQVDRFDATGSPVALANRATQGVEVAGKRPIVCNCFNVTRGDQQAESRREEPTPKRTASTSRPSTRTRPRPPFAWSATTARREREARFSTERRDGRGRHSHRRAKTLVATTPIGGRGSC